MNREREPLEGTLAVLRQNPLFAGMDRERAERLLALMKAEKAFYEKGTMLHVSGTPVRRFGILLSGAVQACVDDIEGNRMIMAEVASGVTFGESLCYLKIPDSPVYIIATEDSEVLLLDPQGLYDGSGDPLYTDLRLRFTAALAAKNLSMNSRIQVLSRLSLRAKLTAYFTQLAGEQGSGVIRLPMNRDDTAAYIGANRSALSRELARMKADGLIDYRRNQVWILRLQEE